MSTLATNPDEMTYEQAFADDDATPVALIPANFVRIGNRILPHNAPTLILSALRVLEDEKNEAAVALAAKTAQSIAQARQFVACRFDEDFGVTLNEEEIDVAINDEGEAIDARFTIAGLELSVQDFDSGNPAFFIHNVPGSSYFYGLTDLGRMLEWPAFNDYFEKLASQTEGCQ